MTAQVPIGEQALQAAAKAIEAKHIELQAKPFALNTVKQYEALAQAALEAATLSRLAEPQACPACSGDCGSANPPMAYCPMRDGYEPPAATLSRLAEPQGGDAGLVEPNWKPPPNWNVPAFHPLACELLAREYERLGEQTDAACIRLGMPVDAASDNACRALTKAITALAAKDAELAQRTKELDISVRLAGETAAELEAELARVREERDDALKELAARLSGKPYFKATHRHKKRGTFYKLLTAVKIQSDSPINDEDVLFLYVDQEGRHWARPPGEFSERFEELAHAALTPDSAAEQPHE